MTSPAQAALARLAKLPGAKARDIELVAGALENRRPGSARGPMPDSEGRAALAASLEYGVNPLVGSWRPEV